MSTTLARRIFLAHLELSYTVGRKVTLAEFGELVAKQLGREAPFSAAAVSRWEAGTQIPSTEVIEAIAAVTGTDPGWISHGDRSAAPPPPRLTPPTGVVAPDLALPRSRAEEPVRDRDRVKGADARGHPHTGEGK
jgi:transcriptional regulator with XRE-family HTH domain